MLHLWLWLPLPEFKNKDKIWLWTRNLSAGGSIVITRQADVMMYCFRASLRARQNNRRSRTRKWFQVMNGSLTDIWSPLPMGLLVSMSSCSCPCHDRTVSSRIMNKTLICYRLHIKQCDTLRTPCSASVKFTVIDFFDIIYSHVFIFKNNVSRTGLCLRPQVNDYSFGHDRQSSSLSPELRTETHFSLRNIVFK